MANLTKPKRPVSVLTKRRVPVPLPLRPKFVDGMRTTDYAETPDVSYDPSKTGAGMRSKTEKFGHEDGTNRG